jgi:DNA-binding transcriptional LysR family regulator
MDLNLLRALDVLLTEGSVVAAAERMNLSPSAMSRTLGRIRQVVGDPILVRAGRNLVPTQRAEAMRRPVHEAVVTAMGLLQPDRALDLSNLDRTFTIRTSDAFVAAFGGRLIAIVTATAPCVRICFRSQEHEDVEAMRQAEIDLDIGVLGQTGPEVRIQTLFHDNFVGVVHRNHPLATREITPERFADERHISASRRGRMRGPIDRELEARGLTRHVVAVAPDVLEALALARASDLVAAVPDRLTRPSRSDMYTFPLPVTTEPIVVSLMWHPRLDADPAHRWLRSCIRQCCAE